MPLIGGAPVVTLAAPGEGARIIGADLAPGLGMNVLQIRARLQDGREVDLLMCPPLGEAAAVLASDETGNAGFSFGGAILAPFANRLTGRVEAGFVLTDAAGRSLRPPANWGGAALGAPRYAMHGLILRSGFTVMTQTPARLVARLDARDFAGGWTSEVRLTVEAAVENGGFQLVVTAENLGATSVPIGLGWHPWFRLPGADRAEVRLHVPAAGRLVVHDYDAVLPTGEVAATLASPYDFSEPGGRPLGRVYLDDCFVRLQAGPDGAVDCEVRDPAAGYGVKITSRSSAIKAVQVYAPTDRDVICVEPQFNWSDPFGAVWPAGSDTGMVWLPPGGQIGYHVEVALIGG